LYDDIYRLSTSSSQDQELVGHLPIELSFLLCNFLSREGCSLEFSPTGARFAENGRRYTAFFKQPEDGINTPYSKMAENALLFCLIVNWPLLPRFHLQNSKEYLA